MCSPWTPTSPRSPGSPSSRCHRAIEQWSMFSGKRSRSAVTGHPHRARHRGVPPKLQTACEAAAPHRPGGPAGPSVAAPVNQAGPQPPPGPARQRSRRPLSAVSCCSPRARAAADRADRTRRYPEPGRPAAHGAAAAAFRAASGLVVPRCRCRCHCPAQPHSRVRAKLGGTASKGMAGARPRRDRGPLRPKREAGGPSPATSSAGDASRRPAHDRVTSCETALRSRSVPIQRVFWARWVNFDKFPSADRFRELEYGRPDGPSLRAAVRTEGPEHERDLVLYLRPVPSPTCSVPPALSSEDCTC
jgi:hypothetical protein